MGQPDSSDPMAVVVVDPHVLFRRGLEDQLNRQPGVQVVATTDSDPVGTVVASPSCSVIVLAWELCSHDPDGLMDSLRRVRPEARVLLLGVADAPSEETALRLGAWGVLLRTVSPNLAGRAAVAVGTGELWVRRETLSRLVLAPRQAIPESPDDGRSRLLSSRELEVLRALAAGGTNESIARDLFVEVSTVRTHVRRIYQKLGVHDRVAAVISAVRHGWLELPVEPK